MKPTNLLAVAALSLISLVPAQADFKEDARKVFEENAPSVYGIRGLLSISATMNGQAAGNQEKPLWSNGTVVADGLLMVAYQSLKPDLGANMAQRPGLEITTELSELKLIDEGGEEYDAKLVLHDEVLGLAFVALDPAGENATSFKSPAIDLSQDVEVAHLDELIGIGRLPENMRFQAQVKTGPVTAIVKKPRTLIQIGQISASIPIFNQSGAAVGFMVVPKASQPGMPIGPVLLPNKYLRDLLAQAKEKQAALAAGGEEKKD